MLEDRQLSQMFLRKGLVDEETLEKANALSESTKRSLYTVLLQDRLVDEERAIVAVSKQLNLPCVSLKEFDANERILELIPVALAEKFKLMPLGLTEEDGERKLYVAMENPLDIDAIEEVKSIAGFPVAQLLAGPNDIREAITRSYSALEQSGHKPHDPAGAGEDDGLGAMLDGLLEEGVSRYIDESSDSIPSLKKTDLHPHGQRDTAEFDIDLAAGTAEKVVPIDVEGKKPEASLDDEPPTQDDAPADADDELGFTLDFGDLGVSLGGGKPKEDVHNRMTLPAGTELPQEALQEPEKPKEVEHGFTRESTAVKKTAEAEKASPKEEASTQEEEQPAASPMDDWGDLATFGLEDDEPAPDLSASRPPPMTGRTETSTIRYVADPSLQERERAGFLFKVPASDLIRATVQLLITKGVFTEDELKKAVHKLRHGG